ncbi:cytochrome-c peroxidase [Roseobacteraceae bacterium S113]
MMRLPSLFIAFLPTAVLAETTVDLPKAPAPADYHQVEPEWAALGRKLFFDPILAGNNNIACATCHHPTLGTGDAMSLSIGEGGEGLGDARIVDASNQPKQRIPRNAPALWNLGAKEFVVMFHDGRVEIDADSMYGIRMPAGRTLERPLDTALAAQNILPILSGDEMAGHPGENPVADAVAADKIHGPGGAWDLIAKEIDEIPAYRAELDWLIGDEEVHIADVARALSNFIAFEFRTTDSPFDGYLRGDHDALSDAEMRGMELFYGKANCASCHAGSFQTDHSFYAIGLPQFGPGKDEQDYEFSDRGRVVITGDEDDSYRFRVPSLRNVALTAPYGHNGAYGTLEGMVRHHLSPMESLASYDRSEAKLHPLDTSRDDWTAMEDEYELMRIADAIEIAPVDLNDTEFDDLMAFLHALTDPVAAAGRLGVPASVPSGLPLDPVSAALNEQQQADAAPKAVAKAAPVRKVSKAAPRRAAPAAPAVIRVPGAPKEFRFISDRFLPGPPADYFRPINASR